MPRFIGIVLLIVFSIFSFANDEIWHRDIAIDDWIADGAEKKDINATLKVIYDKNIDKSGGQLVDDNEIKYKSGNWLYEWVKFAENKAKKPIDSKGLLAVSQYFAIGMTGYDTTHMDENELKKAYESSVKYYEKALTNSKISVKKEEVKNRNDKFTYFIHKSKENLDKTKVAVIYIADTSHIATQSYYFVSEFLNLHNTATIITADLFETSKAKFITKEGFFARLDRLIEDTTEETRAKKIFLMGEGLISNQLITAYTNNLEKLGNYDKIKGIISLCGFNHYQLTKTGFDELIRQERRSLNYYFLSTKNSEYNPDILSNSVFDNPNVNKKKKANILNLYNENYEVYSTDAKLLQDNLVGLVNRPFSENGCINSSSINEIVNWVRQNG